MTKLKYSIDELNDLYDDVANFLHLSMTNLDAEEIVKFPPFYKAMKWVLDTRVKICTELGGGIITLGWKIGSELLHIGRKANMFELRIKDTQGYESTINIPITMYQKFDSTSSEKAEVRIQYLKMIKNRNDRFKQLDYLSNMITESDAELLKYITLYNKYLSDSEKSIIDDKPWSVKTSK